MKIAFSLLKICLVAYFFIAILLYFFQSKLLYSPSPKYDHNYEEIEIKNEGETISVIVLNKSNSNGLIYFGGNGEAVLFNAENFISSFPDMTIYLVNYRGYGGSSGKPSERGLYSDSLALYDVIKTNHKKISTVGRSLGSGVATYLSANRAIDKTVLITPYDSVLSVAKNKFSFWPVGLLLKDKYDSISRVKNIKSQTLIIAAEYDQVIPISHTEKLMNEFSNEKIEYKVIKNSGHNNLSDKSEYYEYIRNFLVGSNEILN